MSNQISFTLSAWATALAMESRTLSRKINAQGIASPKHGKISAKKILIACIGDNAAEKARLLKAQADAQEYENKINDENWLQKNEVEEFLTLTFLALRQKLLSLPNEVDAKCNPHDPQLANIVVMQAVDEILKLCAEKLPPKRKE